MEFDPDNTEASLPSPSISSSNDEDHWTALKMQPDIQKAFTQLQNQPFEVISEEASRAAISAWLTLAGEGNTMREVKGVSKVLETAGSYLQEEKDSESGSDDQDAYDPLCSASPHMVPPRISSLSPQDDVPYSRGKSATILNIPYIKHLFNI